MSFNSEIAEVDAEIIAEFGEDASYQSVAVGAEPVDLKVVFDEAFHLSQTEGPHGAIQSTSPGCVLDASDLPNGADGLSTEGDTITINEVAYFITGSEPSAGLVQLRLSENDPT